MPAYKKTIKNIPPLKRGFKAEAERISVNYRKALELSEYDPLPAKNLAEHLGIKILIPNDIPGITEEILSVLHGAKGKDQWSAVFLLNNEKKYIIHNPTHSLPRQESNLMHELAHATCNHELCGLETTFNNIILPLREYNLEQEAEAEYLGGCLQLPKTALLHYYHRLSKTNEEIAEIFSASKQMVTFRLSITGVTKIKKRF